tara:strand:+ start:846 stop:1478 length:633 start_codon:yes stop_codon:yes gene_type:complete
MNLYNIINPKPDLDYFEDFMREEFDNRVPYENQKFEDIIKNKLNSLKYSSLKFDFEIDTDISILTESFEIYFEDNIGSAFRNSDTLQELEFNILDIYDEFVKEYLINPFIEELKKKELTEFDNVSILKNDTIEYNIEFICPLTEFTFSECDIEVEIKLCIDFYEEYKENLAPNIISNFIYEKSYNPHNKFGRHMISWRAEQEGIVPKEND